MASLTTKEKKAASPAFKLDIFKILPRLNRCELGLWNTLEKDEQKGFSSFMITRWMSGTKDALQIMMIDAFVNPYIFNLGTSNGYKIDHNELLCKLLACCGMNDGKRFTWIPESKKGNKNISPKALEVVMDYFDYSKREALPQFQFLSKDDIIELAVELGYQDDELKQLKKELK